MTVQDAGLVSHFPTVSFISKNELATRKLLKSPDLSLSKFCNQPHLYNIIVQTRNHKAWSNHHNTMILACEYCLDTT